MPADIHPLDPARLHTEARWLAIRSGQPHAVIRHQVLPVDCVASAVCVGCGEEPDGGPHLCARCALVLSNDIAARRGGEE